MTGVQPIYKKVLQWVVLSAAYGYLLYRLCTYTEYASLFAYFREADGRVYIWLVLALLLVPINILLEAAKWRTLTAEIEKINLMEAVKQVCYGQLTAFVTPYRIGDYPGRILRMDDKTKWPLLLGAGVVNSATITAVILLFGLPAAANSLLSMDWATSVVFLLLLLVGIGILPWLTDKAKPKQLLLALGQSVLRYMVWLVQLAMVLCFAGVELDFRTLVTALPTYYLFVTVTPSMPAADVAVRGSWMLLVLGAYTDQTASIALAAMGIWILNTVLPMSVGTFFRK